MSVGKIFLGAAIIVIGITIWFSMFSGMLDVFVPSPQERHEFRESLKQFQTIYFLIMMGLGIGTIVWGAQT